MKLIALSNFVYRVKDKDFEEIRALSIEAGLTPKCQVKFRAKINEIMENYDRKFVLDSIHLVD